MFDFSDPFSKEPEPLAWVPDSAEDLIEGWRKADEVRAAEEQLAAAKELEAKNNAEIAEINDELAALERKMQALRNKQFTLRGQLTTAERDQRRAEQVIRVAKENYEARQREEKALAEIRNLDETQFAWGKGIEINGETAKIKPHQKLAAEIIAAYGNLILADEMGAGKTLTMIASMDYAKVKRALVITPADITSNFLREIRMWAPHRMSVDLRGQTKGTRDEIFAMAQMIVDSDKPFVMVTNYESWRKDSTVIEQILDLGFEQIFMDESHVMKDTGSMNFKGAERIVNSRNLCADCKKPLSQTQRAVNTHACGCGSLNREQSIRSVVPATGTPILNNPADIFSLLTLVDGNNFPNLYDFLRNYAAQDVYTGNWVFKPGGEESLLTRLGHRFIKRTMEDVGIELPTQQIIHHELLFDGYEDQREAYEELTKYGQILCGTEDEWGNPKSVSAASVLAQITRQRQCTVWPAGIQVKNEDGVVIASVGDRVNESVKIDKTINLIIEAVARGERVAVFSQFATGLSELERRLNASPIRAVRFDGSTSTKVREEVKANFNASVNEESKWDVVLANYKTGGVGLNLTACTTMILLDLEWNPGRENQALARIKRIGQTKKTFVHILSVNKTVDTWMRALIREKQDLVDGFNTQQRSLQEEYMAGISSGEI